MKRNFTAKSLFLLAAILVASFANKVNAQVEWGIMGGMNNSNMSGSKYGIIDASKRPKFSGISRYRVAIFMDMPINNYFSFSPELAYSVKGSVQKLDTIYTGVDPINFVGYSEKREAVANIDLNYIEIPLLFRFSTPLGRPTSMYPYENSVHPWYLDFILGPHVSYLLSSKNSQSITRTVSSDNDTSAAYNFAEKTKTNSALPLVKKIDYGVVMGFGIKWRFNRKSYLYLDARYTMSFGNINGGYWDQIVPQADDPTKLIKVSPKVKNAGSLSISLGFITNFSKRRYFDLYKPDRNRP
jgi:hypothetical protein